MKTCKKGHNLKDNIYIFKKGWGCKTCVNSEENKRKRRESAKAYYYKNREEILKKQSAYLKTSKGRQQSIIRFKKRVLKYPEKVRAKATINDLLRRKVIRKEPCALCGSTIKVQGHHKDYSKPKEVVWLCVQHHADVHSRKIEV